MSQDNTYANIRSFRERLGLSQADMAYELGIGRTTYINFETGKTNLYCKTLMKIVDHFGVDPKDVLGGREESLLEEKRRDEKERTRAIVNDYEDRLGQLREKISSLENVLKKYEGLVSSLTETNKFLLNQLRKND